jgi:hypothetical protein
VDDVTGQRAVEHVAAIREHAAVVTDQPVAVALRVGDDAEDELHSAGGGAVEDLRIGDVLPLEAGVFERVDASGHERRVDGLLDEELHHIPAAQMQHAVRLGAGLVQQPRSRLGDEATRDGFLSGHARAVVVVGAVALVGADQGVRGEFGAPLVRFVTPAGYGVRMRTAAEGEVSGVAQLRELDREHLLVVDGDVDGGGVLIDAAIDVDALDVREIGLHLAVVGPLVPADRQLLRVAVTDRPC